MNFLTFTLILLLSNVYSIIFCTFPIYEQVPGKWAHKTLAQLTLREKIGQLFMVATASCLNQREEILATNIITCPYKMDHAYISFLIKEYKIGGLIFLYKSTSALQIDAINQFQKQTTIPLLIGQDGEWGLSMRLYDTIRFPHNMTLGAIQNKKLIYQMGREVGKQCKAMGIHINFSPVIDVQNNPHNLVIHDRSFGDSPHAVAEAGLLMMSGLQDEGILACAKHFPGHGNTDKDSHTLLPIISLTKQQLESLELIPFRKLIDNKVAAIMSGHIAVPALQNNSLQAATVSYPLITELLEKEFNFKGLKVTDGLGMKALTNDYTPGYLELNAFLAGNDILLCPLDVPLAVELIEQAIEIGKISIQELDKRVLKILKAKEWTGCNERRVINKPAALGQLQSHHALTLTGKLYQESITLIKMRDRTDNRVNLNNEKTAILSLDSDGSIFTDTMLQHYPFKVFNLVGKEKTIEYLAKLKQFTTIIIPLFRMNKFLTKQYGISQLTFDILELLKEKQIIIIPFGTPYCIPLLSTASRIIMAYEDDAEAQKAAAYVLLNKIVPKGMLPINLS